MDRVNQLEESLNKMGWAKVFALPIIWLVSVGVGLRFFLKSIFKPVSYLKELAGMLDLYDEVIEMNERIKDLKDGSDA